MTQKHTYFEPIKQRILFNLVYKLIIGLNTITNLEKYTDFAEHHNPWLSES